MTANNLSLNMLREFAPANSPLFAYRLESTGNPMHDWVKHIAAHKIFRQNLEETSLLGGNVVVRAVEGDEKPALELVKILSLSYAVRFFGNVEDGKEFVRCVQAIADPKASQFELEQIASHYYRECRTRPVPEVLKEMAFLGMEMTLVTAEINDLTVKGSETESERCLTGEIKLTVAEQRKIRELQKNLPPLPPRTPNFDSEMQAVEKSLSRSRISQAINDEFAAFFLAEEGKTLTELDEDYLRFEEHGQYDENGLLNLRMSGSTHTEVVLELDAEITADYLPEALQPLAKCLQLVFVGYEIGGLAAQSVRHFAACRKIENSDNIRAREAFRLNAPFSETEKPLLTEFPLSPLSRQEISEWIDLQLDAVYSRDVIRSARRIGIRKTGESAEYMINQSVNPDFEEKQYAGQILQILLEQMERDFHFIHLRRNKDYQSIYLKIRSAKDTAVLTNTAEIARRAKEEKCLSLKEYTALSTVAKSQFGRLRSARPSAALYRLEKEIINADSRKISYLKWAMFGKNQPAHPVHGLPKQEVQRAWTALKARELELKQKAVRQPSLSPQQQQQLQFNLPNTSSQVKVTTIVH